jgi:DNA-binding MarR family transcriptional regulator
VDLVDELAAGWAREHPKLATETLNPLVRLHRIAIRLADFERDVVTPHGLGPSDARVLALLRRAGPPYRVSPSELYGKLGHSSGGMTKILKRLEEAKRIERVPDPNDGRGLLVGLTREGLALQGRVFAAFLTASRELFGSLSASKLREVDRALRTLQEALDRDPSEPD